MQAINGDKWLPEAKQLGQWTTLSGSLMITTRVLHFATSFANPAALKRHELFLAELDKAPAEYPWSIHFCSTRSMPL